MSETLPLDGSEPAAADAPPRAPLTPAEEREQHRREAAREWFAHLRARLRGEA